MSTRIDLPPELEAFARDCVTSGRYSDTGDVIRAALRQLQDAEAHRHSFAAMLAETRAEADTIGTYDVATVLAEMDAIIDTRAAKLRVGRYGNGQKGRRASQPNTVFFRATPRLAQRPARPAG